MLVIDASLAIRLVMPEVGSDQARALWETWTEQREQILVPPIYVPEVLSALRGKVYRRAADEHIVDEAREALTMVRVQVREPEGLYDRAWRIATEFGLPNVYDASYLALAEIEDCEFWTVDGRFSRAVRSPRIRLLGGAPDA